MIFNLWPHCSCPNGLVTSNTAPAYPHATWGAVYPALFWLVPHKFPTHDMIALFISYPKPFSFYFPQAGVWCGTKRTFLALFLIFMFCWIFCLPTLFEMKEVVAVDTTQKLVVCVCVCVIFLVALSLRFIIPCRLSSVISYIRIQDLYVRGRGCKHT